MQASIYIICRDRLEPLRSLVSWFERAGQDRIFLVDNDSSYPPLLDYYASTPHEVVRLGKNLGHRSPWEAGLVTGLREPYVVTDPDVIPDERCPLDAIDRLGELLARHPGRVKVGLGLRIDDLPGRYKFAREVRRWEAQFWDRELGPGVYDAAVDTTFALYRPGVPFALEPSLRTGAPYLARHQPWYADSANPTDEELYYRNRCRPDVANWGAEELPATLRQAIARL